MDNEKNKETNVKKEKPVKEKPEKSSTENQKPDVEKLTEEIEALKKENAEIKDKWMRNVAEFDNYKKRNASLYSEAFADGEKEAIIKILPVGDNLDWAMTLDLDEKTLEGLKNIKRKFDETLKSMEVEEINPVGEVFNPEIAEAIMQVEGEEGEQSDTVKSVLYKGYKLKGKIIRYAKVSVVK